MEFEAPTLLYGAGREGKSTFRFIKSRNPGARIYVATDKDDSDIEGAEFAPAADVKKWLADGEFGLVVKSPGVPLSHPAMEAARQAGVPVTSNINLWGDAFRAGKTLLAITGTKGKSTSATLLAGMLNQSGIRTGLGGNVGVPPLELGNDYGTVVFELSSFQTANLSFSPDFAAITSLYPEHLDWHGSPEQYIADKTRLLRLEPLAKVALGPQAAVHPGLDFIRAAVDRQIPDLDRGAEEEIEDAVLSSRLKGRHNFHNCVLAARMAFAAGANLDGILTAIAEFEPLPHRLQEFYEGGVTFVDDSIATTPEATKAALAAYAGQRIALIAGGYDRGQDFSELGAMLWQSGVTVLAALPDNGDRIARAALSAAPDLPVIAAPDLKSAMRSLADRTGSYDVVVLSPGAPSFNQFKDFADRGLQFRMFAAEFFG